MTTAIVWLRQDLRCHDNPALAEATAHYDRVIPLYIKEKSPQLPMGGAQKWWLHHSLIALALELKQFNLSLCLKSGNPLAILQELIRVTQADAVYWNRCYEPSAIARDKNIKQILKEEGLQVSSSNGSLLIEPWEVKNKSGGFFKVFTPFWKTCLTKIHIRPLWQITAAKQLFSISSDNLDEWDLVPKTPNWAEEFPSFWQPGEKNAMAHLTHFIEHHLVNYKTQRNVPSQSATSHLSPYLHFGEISPQWIWHMVHQAMLQPGCSIESAQMFLSELGWREFSYHLLYHFPKLPDTSFKSQFDTYPWQDNPQTLSLWQKGLTGYPIVDAGMRELWRTGYMHNRVRMIVASFLTKDLLIDWRKGAEWFWDTLLDADLANNSASWQWVAGSGADASPYYRIFNPVLQGEKFDAEGEYVRRWVPELREVPNRWIHKPWEAPKNHLPITLGKEYPLPIVDHAQARQIALMTYQKLTPPA